MNLNKKGGALAAALLAGALTLSACGAESGGGSTNSSSSPSSSSSASESPTPSETAEKLVGQAATESDAAGLRALLTAQLQEHVYLAGTATGVGLSKGVDSPEFAAAAEALDANSVALSESVGSVYGDEAAQQFLELWRAHIGFFVDYTVGSATGDQAKVDAAKTSLDNYRQDFGAFIDSATNGELPADAIAENLQVHVNTLIEAIDAQIAGNPEQFTQLREAAAHMPMTAATLAGGIDKQKEFEGDTESDASGLRALLTAQLQEHVYLAGTATGVGLAEGVDSPLFAAAAEALDANSVALSESIGSVYGDEAAQAFLEQWRAHIGFFVDYTVGSATGDQAKVDAARTSLENYRADFSAFIETATEGELPAEALSENLQEHVNTLIEAIDAQIAGNPEQFTQLREAAAHMSMSAAALSGAIAEQKQLEG